MGEKRTLEELVGIVTTEGEALASYFNSNSYYQPSFQPGGFKEYPELPQDVEYSRMRLKEAAKAVYDLTNGPTNHVKNSSWQVSSNMSIDM